MALALIFCLAFLFLPLAKTNPTLDPVLQAIERLVDFYQNDFRKLNVDGLFGLRILEGHFGLILQKYEAHKLDHLDPYVITRIKAMKVKASQTANLSLHHVREDDLDYFKHLSFVVESPWTVFDDEQHQFDSTKIWNQEAYKHAKQTVKLDEQVSDKCMSELIGSHKKGGTPCDISATCVETMTAPGLVGYGNTHQILWTMLGEKAGCKSQLEDKLKVTGRGTLMSLRQEMCTNNFYQLKETLAKLGSMTVIPAFQDLFLEQLFICPSLGYREFLHPDFLPQILSWQLKPGCYGKMKRPKNAVKLDNSIKGKFSYDYDDDDYGAFDTLLNGIHLENVVRDGKLLNNGTVAVKVGKKESGIESWEIPHNKGRKLLVEKEMTGGCLAHKTAVASGALAVYLRVLCETDVNTTFNKTRLSRSTKLSDIDSGLVNGKADNLGNINQVENGVVIESNKGGALNMKLEKPIEQNLAVALDHKAVESHPAEKVNLDLSNNVLQLKNLDLANRKVDNTNAVKVIPNVANGGPDVKNDMSDLNHHLNQLNAPDLNEQKLGWNDNKQNIRDENIPNIGHPGVVKPALDDKMVADDDEGNDEDLGENARRDDGVEDDQDEGDDDQDEDDDYDDENDEDPDNNDEKYYDNQKKDDANDDDYYDERDVKMKVFPKEGADLGINQPVGGNHLNNFKEEGDYDNGDNNDDEDEDIDNDADDDDDEYDDGYDDNDRNNVDGVEGVHPHINLRNIGRRDYRLNDGGINDDRNFNLMHDYKNKIDDDEEEEDDAGDDYEYDDENDEMAKRRQEELKGDVQFEDTVKKSYNYRQGAMQKDPLHGGETLSPATAFFVFGFCITLVLILMYKFIRKRRIRIRFNPKYFNV